MDFPSIPIYSMLSIRKLYSIYHLTFGKDYRFPGEQHDFWEMSYILSGHSGVTSGEKIYLLEEGDAVVNSPNLFHNMWTIESEPCESLTVSFDGVGLENRLKAGKYRLSEEDHHSVQVILKELPKLFDGFDRTEFTPLECLSFPDNVGYQIIKSHLELLCLSLVRQGEAMEDAPSSDENALCYARICAFLRDHVESALTMEELCQGVYQSSGKIKSIFHRFTGGGVMKYYNLLRCKHVMNLLSVGKSVQEIAAQMNFSSPYYLSYFFKRETGMTPRDFIRQKNQT